MNGYYMVHALTTLE